jgi:hypothetical protein
LDSDCAQIKGQIAGEIFGGKANGIFKQFRGLDAELQTCCFLLQYNVQEGASIHCGTDLLGGRQAVGAHGCRAIEAAEEEALGSSRIVTAPCAVMLRALLRCLPV